MVYESLSAKKSELDKLPALSAEKQEELRKKIELEIAYVGGFFVFSHRLLVNFFTNFKKVSKHD